MSGTTVFSCSQLLVGLLGQQPTTVCLQHTYRLLVRSSPESIPSTRQVLEAWAAVNDTLFRHEGYLPYEVFEEFARLHGEDVARLIVSFDNLFITGQDQQSAQRISMTPRTQPLKESVQLLLRAVEEEGGDGGKTLSHLIKWANDSGVPGHPANDYNDADILVWWAGGARMSMVSPQLAMGDLTSMAMAMTGQQSSFLMPPSMLLAQQQQQQAQQQQAQQKPRVPTPTQLAAAQSSLLQQQQQQQQRALQNLLVSRSPSPTARSSPTPSFGTISTTATTQVSRSPGRLTPSPRSSAATPMERTGATTPPPGLTGPRAADGGAAMEEPVGMASGLAMLYELWLSRAQGLSEAKVQQLQQATRSSLSALWVGGDAETYKVSKNQVPKAVQSLLESRGVRRGVPGLDESWEYFLRFLEIKTQPIVSPDLKDLLTAQMGGKGASGGVSVVLQLLPEVAMEDVKPITSLKGLKDYVDLHGSELQALVDLLHRGSGIYKTALQSLIDFCQAPGGHKLEAEPVGKGNNNNAMDVCREEGQ